MVTCPEVPHTSEEIYLAIDELIAGVEDPEVAYNGNRDSYSKCIEAMWQAGYLATEYVAKKLGVTGMQGSLAMLMLYGASMHINGPFIVLKAEDALYPQYDLHARLTDFLDDAGPWLAEQARECLNTRSDHAVPAVRAHWQALIDNTPEETE